MITERPNNSKFICVQSSVAPAKEQSWEVCAQHIFFTNQKINKEKSTHMERTPITRALQLVRNEMGKADKDLQQLYAELQELLEVEKQHIEQSYRWGFTDGTRYTNKVSPFYSTAGSYFTNNFLQS
jgi:hypothetical protein